MSIMSTTLISAYPKTSSGAYGWDDPPEPSRKLLHYNTTYGRGCEIDSVFVVTQEQWETLLAVCQDGAPFSFGEICGKHSDVVLYFNIDEFLILSEDEDEISLFLRWFPGGTVGTYIMGQIEAQLEDV